jgi:hypothetical protein
VSASALRTAGSRARSPIVCDSAYLCCSKPNDPAMPQQPAHAGPMPSGVFTMMM